MSKISGPLDRIDIHIEVTPVPFENYQTTKAKRREKSDCSANYNTANGKIHYNAQMNTTYVGRSVKQLLKTAMERLNFR
jgi:magnesium chelatase family protein